MVATVVTEQGLKIPNFDAAYTDAKGRNVGKFFNNPEILRHSILQAMFQYSLVSESSHGCPYILCIHLNKY